MGDSDFKVKRYKNRKKYYVGVWKKGHRGFYANFPYNKDNRVRRIKKLLTGGEDVIKGKKPMGKLYRIIQARVYEYKQELRLGQFRLEIYTYNPKRYRTRLLYAKLRKAEKYMLAVNKQFRKMMRYVTDKYYLAREVHVIDIDEQRSLNLDIIWCDVIGFGIANRYKQVRFKV